MKENPRRVISRGVILIPLISILVFCRYRSWNLRWGATDAEVERIMAGDAVVALANFVATRAITIKAGPEKIWPWIIQMGYKKGGFYSYDWLDNAGIPSAERIIPQFQGLKVGDLIPLDRNSFVKVKELIPFQLLLLVCQDGAQPIFTWAWKLDQIDEHATRLVSRIRWRHDSPIHRILCEYFEFFMMRECLLGIKRRAETSPGTNREGIGRYLTSATTAFRTFLVSLS